VRQNLGWRPDHGGEIGGIVWRTRTPAWYGTPVGPFSFDAAFSASGRLVLMPATRTDGAYFGFFNAARQEWRPWSSLAVRIGEIRTPGAAETIVDYMSAGWRAGGFTTGSVPADGKPHTWRLAYEPNVTVPTTWEDARLRDAMGGARRTEDEILSTLRKDEPALTPQALRDRISAASKLGLILFQTRRGVGWEARKEPAKVKGRILFQLDAEPEQAHFLDLSIRNERVTIDRFGIFNFQLPGGPTEFYLSDLVLNGRPVDLSSDPGWEGHGNRTEFVERDFHARQDFGFSRTNFAGKAAGEIGGTLWRTEPVDPLHAFYADDVGRLTLDDPIEFAGQIAFTAGATDAGMFFGYFNVKDQMPEFKLDQGGEAGAPLPNTMGMAIEGPTRIGYYLSAQVSPTRETSSHSDGPVFVPTGDKHAFTFAYDPRANNGVGRVTITVDGKPYVHDLRPEQRKAGATFDRFGITNIRRGGKYVTVYLDDLTYTARRPANYQPVRHEEKVVHAPYPENGRKY
jgi:hypothetical protein